MDINIRRAKAEDVPFILQLIKELAAYEHEPDAVINTEMMMREDGFGTHSIYRAFVAEINNEIIGMALYYTAYSTWNGKIIYLDDIVVTERKRRLGVGNKLIQAVLKEASIQKVNQIRWQVLDWNKPAIEFYKKIGVEFDAAWINCKMNRAAIENYISNLQ